MGGTIAELLHQMRDNPELQQLFGKLDELKARLEVSKLRAFGVAHISLRAARAL